MVWKSTEKEFLRRQSPQGLAVEYKQQEKGFPSVCGTMTDLLTNKFQATLFSPYNNTYLNPVTMLSHLYYFMIKHFNDKQNENLVTSQGDIYLHSQVLRKPRQKAMS